MREQFLGIECTRLLWIKASVRLLPNRGVLFLRKSSEVYMPARRTKLAAQQTMLFEWRDQTDLNK
jgi:hypothetical protein